MLGVGMSLCGCRLGLDGLVVLLVFVWGLKELVLLELLEWGFWKDVAVGMGKVWGERCGWNGSRTRILESLQGALSMGVGVEVGRAAVVVWVRFRVLWGMVDVPLVLLLIAMVLWLFLVVVAFQETQDVVIAGEGLWVVPTVALRFYVKFLLPSSRPTQTVSATR